jgi:hypothetical protein
LKFNHAVKKPLKICLTYWCFIVIIIRSVTEQIKNFRFLSGDASYGAAVACPQFKCESRNKNNKKVKRIKP